MKNHGVRPVIAALFVLAAARGFAQNQGKKAKALEGDWVVTRVQHDDTIISEPMMAEAGSEIFFVFENNMMMLKGTRNGKTEILVPAEEIVVGDTTLLDPAHPDQPGMPYRLEGDMLTLTFMEGDTILIILTCKRRQ
ncbi:hypothetical protein LQZ21_14135 [Treponema sp. TIM-1]|uniref:hypothetical protein n=1 Tax=Treponema sp. TIM-1 TaxID=2898417 RepID=UPI00397FCAA2